MDKSQNLMDIDNVDEMNRMGQMNNGNSGHYPMPDYYPPRRW